MAHETSDIIGGPSKWDLMLGFFDKQKGQRRYVKFTIRGRETPQVRMEIDVLISLLGWEDNSGESWFFEGMTPGHIFSAPSSWKGQVKGWFSTSTRKGWIKPVV